MPNAPAYDPIGDNKARWYECVNLLKATSQEHRNTYQEDDIEGHIQTLKEKEANYLRVWYIPNAAETEIDFVAFFQKMKSLSAKKKTEIWALSVGFKQSLIPYSPPDDSTVYESFLKKYFEDSHGRCGGGQSLSGKITGTPAGVLGYFLKNVIGGGNITEVYSVGVKSNQLDLNGTGGEKITRLERSAIRVYNTDQDYWKIDANPYISSHKQWPWGGGTKENPTECVVYRTQLKKNDPEGP